MTELTPLQRAIDVCGSAAALARVLNIKPQAVAQWDKVPPARALAVSRATGIPVEELLGQQAAE